VYYLLRRARATPIGSIPVGKTAKVVGKIRAYGPPLAALFARVPCVFYRSTVWNAGQYLCGEQQITDFLVEDSTGRALVRIESRSSQVFVDLNRRSETRGVPLDSQRLLLERHGYGTGGPFEYLEERLDEGAVVAVRGRVSWQPHELGEAATLREPPRIRVLSASSSWSRLLVSDSPATLG
jgi:hypothetical protein